MHIAHINLSKEYRGGEFQTSLLAHTLATETDISQTVIVRRGSSFAKNLDLPKSVDIVEIKPTIVRAVKAAINADIAHIHEGRSTKVGALLNKFGTPAIFTRRIARAPKDATLTRWIYRQAAAIPCVSRAVADIMNQYDPDLPVQVIYDALRPLNRESVRLRTRNHMVVGSIGALNIKDKGMDRVISVARAVAKLDSNIRFVVAGSGKDREYLQRMAMDLDNLEFIGEISDVGSFYDDLDVLLHVPRSEGLGTVVLEAMSMGVPVVACNTGGIAELLIDQSNGWLLQDFDKGSAAQAIATLCENASLREFLGRTARRDAAKFSPTIMAHAYRNLYCSLLKSPQNSPAASS